MAKTEPDWVALDPIKETSTGNDSVYRLLYPVHGKNTGFLCLDELDLEAAHVYFSATPITYCVWREVTDSEAIWVKPSSLWGFPVLRSYRYSVPTQAKCCCLCGRESLNRGSQVCRCGLPSCEVACYHFYILLLVLKVDFI